MEDSWSDDRYDMLEVMWIFPERLWFQVDHQGNQSFSTDVYLWEPGEEKRKVFHADGAWMDLPIANYRLSETGDVLWVIHPDGDSAQALGRRILFIRRKDEYGPSREIMGILYTWTVDGGEVELVDDPVPVWLRPTPDGKKVYYYRYLETTGPSGYLETEIVEYNMQDGSRTTIETGYFLDPVTDDGMIYHTRTESERVYYYWDGQGAELLHRLGG